MNAKGSTPSVYPSPSISWKISALATGPLTIDPAIASLPITAPPLPKPEEKIPPAPPPPQAVNASKLEPNKRVTFAF